MTDRELLELAAKAAGRDPRTIDGHFEWDSGRCLTPGWNPFEDESDSPI